MIFWTSSFPIGFCNFPRVFFVSCRINTFLLLHAVKIQRTVLVETNLCWLLWSFSCFLAWSLARFENEKIIHHFSCNPGFLRQRSCHVAVPPFYVSSQRHPIQDSSIPKMSINLSVFLWLISFTPHIALESSLFRFSVRISFS